MELDTVRKLNRKVKALEEKIERLRAAQQSTVPVIDGMPCGGFRRRRRQR